MIVLLAVLGRTRDKSEWIMHPMGKGEPVSAVEESAVLGNFKALSTSPEPLQLSANAQKERA